MKLLKERYKTLEGAQRRCGFENAIAKREYERGYTARHYHYTMVKDDDGFWRVARETKP